MNRLHSWTVAAVFVLAMTGAVQGVDPPAERDGAFKKASWYSWLFAAPKEEKAREDAAASRPESHAPLESAAAFNAREKADWLRRVAVCDKLHEIAVFTNDDKLRHWADQLDQRAWDMYLKRMAQGSAAARGLAGTEAVLQGANSQRQPRVNSQPGQSQLSPGIRGRDAGQASSRGE